MKPTCFKPALALAYFLMTSACASGPDDGVMMIVAPLERRVSQKELKAAVQREVFGATVCLPIPVAWWDQINQFSVRIGPTAFRGQPIPADVEARLDDLVQMGFWTKTIVREDAPRQLQFALTGAGERYLQGRPYGGGAFCPPAERQLLRIVSVTRPPERDRHGPTLVKFEWAGSERLSWLAGSEVPERYKGLFPDSRTIGVGDVRLYRVWRRSERSIESAPRSGVLEPFCYDYVHFRVERCGARFR